MVSGRELKQNSNKKIKARRLRREIQIHKDKVYSAREKERQA